MEFGEKNGNEPQKLGFLLLPSFSLMAYASTSEPLRIANWLKGETLYEWHLISETGTTVEASSGMQVPVDSTVSDVDFLPMVITCASHNPETAIKEKAIAWLRRLSSRGALLGTLDTGSDVLAMMGLLDGYRATTHWAHLDVFAEHYPNVELTRDLFVIDRQRFSAGGGTAGTDMMLHLITLQHGRDLAVAVAEQISYNRMREGNEPQRMDTGHRLATSNRYVIQAVEQMETHIEDPLRTSDIADLLGISLRELERAFQKALKNTPGAYYRRMRLDKSRKLLKQTDLSVLDVAVSCGFTSSAHFSRCYRENYGKPPSSDRD